MKFFTNRFLRNPIVFLCFFCCISQKSRAQWAAVGANGGQTVLGTGSIGTNSQGSDYTVLVVDTLTGTLYTAYSDLGNSSKIAVKKFDGTNWVFVGTPYFSTGAARYIDMAFDPSGVPYVFYVDGSLGSKSAVKKFDGTSWVNVGPATGMNSGNSAFDKITFSKTGTPYVAFVDYSSVINGRMTAMTFNGTAWVTVGTAGFSTGAGNSCTIKTDAAGKPYVAYGNAANTNKMTVSRFNGTAWEAVGPATGFSAAAALNGTMSIADDGTLYTAYADGTRSNRITVKKYDGTNWVSVGTDGFTASAVTTQAVYKQLSLTIDKNIFPVVAYADAGAASKASAMRFDGTAWSLVGNAGFSNNTNTVKYVNLVQYRNTLYSSFVDVTNWTSAVMKYVLCTQSTAATVAASKTTVCLGDNVILSVTAGTLNDATNWVWYTGSCGGTLVGTGTQINVSPTVPTTYYVRGEGGCTSSTPCASIAIDVLPLPVKPVVSLITGVSGGLSSSYANNNQWAFNGTDITAADQQLYAPTQTGNYTVTYTNDKGCKNTSLPYLATVNSAVNADGIDLFPNPAKKYVRIKFPYIIPNFYVTIYSLEREKIQTTQFQNTSLVTLDIEKLQPGVYLVKVFSADGSTKTFRLVKGN